MDKIQNEENQAASSQEHSETPPEHCLITVLNPNNVQITSLQNKMMEFQQEELNDVKNRLSLQEKPWQEKYAALDRRYQMKLGKSIMRMRETTQTSQKILEKNFKAVLNRNHSLRAQLKEACSERTLLKDSHNLLMDARQSMVDELKRLIDERTVLLEERTLLENICLMLKKKCRGTFGRSMQGRDFELAKMKRKMLETQTLMQTQR
ncbi:uncharacterized protein [Clinocottus analis]|uniref:uncharacterized protein n=1 Tax=Clinocottus analis TaxID=304258 RepID=UPI0035BEE7EA